MKLIRFITISSIFSNINNIIIIELLLKGVTLVLKMFENSCKM